MKKINLLYVIHSFNNGGAETLAIRLSEKIDSKKFNVAVCSLCDEGPLRAIVEKKNIPFYSLGKLEGKDFGIIFRLRKLIKNGNFHIVHTHNQGPLLYSYLATRFIKNIVLIHTEHINISKEFSYSWKSFVYCRFIYRSLHGFVSIAQHLTEGFKSSFGLKKTRVATILNSVDTVTSNHMGNGLCKELKLREDQLIIGNISALRKQKDHITLIQAMPYIIKEEPNAVLVIAGEGETEKELKLLVDAKQLSKSVYFLGYRADTNALLQQFNLFVLSSLYEGLPLCILEAMAAGLPVVATNVEGSNELVIDGITGMLVPSQKPNELAQAITSILSDPEKAKSMGTAGNKLINEKYNMRMMLTSYEEYYASFFD